MKSTARRVSRIILMLGAACQRLRPVNHRPRGGDMGTKVRSIALVMALLVGMCAFAYAEEEEPAVPSMAEVQVVEEAPAANDQCVARAESDPTLVMGVTCNAKGTVYLYDERRPEVWATMGTRQGLRPEAMVAFVRNGEVVAEGCVVEVRNADCVIAPAPGTPAGTILRGDDVRVLVNGSREALDAKIRREHSDQALGSFAAFAILFGNIWAVRY